MILNRMLLRLHLRTLLVSLGVLLVFSMVMDFFESANRLLSGQGTTFDVLMFCLCKIPDMLVLLLPISLVVSTCVAFAIMGRSLELRALAAAGIGPLRMTGPLLLVAAGVVLATLLLAEFLVPPALNKIENLMSEKFGRIDSTWQFFRNHHWYQGEDGRIFQMTGKSFDGHSIDFATALQMDTDFHITRRTDVRNAVWEKDHWVGRRVTIREFENGEIRALQRQKNARLIWSEKPKRFRDLRGRPKQKTFGELISAIEEMEKRGYQATEYRLQLNNRIAFPLLGFCLVLLSFPWLSVPKRRSTLAVALTESIGLIFAAYFFVSLSTAAVSGGLLDARLGAWLPLITVLVMALPGWIIVLRDQFIIKE